MLILSIEAINSIKYCIEFRILDTYDHILQTNLNTCLYRLDGRRNSRQRQQTRGISRDLKDVI